MPPAHCPHDTKRKNHDLTKLACDIAAVIEEKDPLTDTTDCDISLRISALRQHRALNRLAQWRRVAQIAAEYRKMVKTNDEDNTNDFRPMTSDSLLPLPILSA